MKALATRLPKRVGGIHSGGQERDNGNPLSLRRVLDLCGGHLGRTAQTLGISRKNLWEKMKKLGLSEPQRDNAS
jgi:DNA-binding NtrC family response regulator